MELNIEKVTAPELKNEFNVMKDDLIEHLLEHILMHFNGKEMIKVTFL